MYYIFYIFITKSNEFINKGLCVYISVFFSHHYGTEYLHNIVKQAKTDPR